MAGGLPGDGGRRIYRDAIHFGAVGVGQVVVDGMVGICFCGIFRIAAFYGSGVFFNLGPIPIFPNDKSHPEGMSFPPRMREASKITETGRMMPIISIRTLIIISRTEITTTCKRYGGKLIRNDQNDAFLQYI